MATELDLPKEILDLEDWVALGQGTSKVADYQVKMHQYIRALCAAVKKQNEEITDLRKRVLTLEQQQQEVDKSPALQTWSMMAAGKKQSEQQQVLIASVKKDLRDAERIENNIIISGAGAGNSDEQDTAWVNEVLRVLNLDRDTHVKSQRRIKTSRMTRLDKPIDMIVVEFKNETAKNTALRGAKKLRDTTDLNQIYINPDKTPSERALEASLRKLRDERNNALTEIKPNTQGRHRYGIKPTGHAKAGKKYYWGIRWNELREIYFE